MYFHIVNSVIPDCSAYLFWLTMPTIDIRCIRLTVERLTEVEHKIAEFIKSNQQVLHLSIHSFTPNLNGDERIGDIGLLYDSRKKKEREFCKKLKDKFLQQNPNLKVRFNYPYLGKADGFTTFLRKQFPMNYLGIEIEINQKFANKDLIDLELKKTIYNVLNHHHN